MTPVPSGTPLLPRCLPPAEAGLTWSLFQALRLAHLRRWLSPLQDCCQPPGGQLSFALSWQLYVQKGSAVQGQDQIHLENLEQSQGQKTFAPNAVSIHLVFHRIPKNSNSDACGKARKEWEELPSQSSLGRQQTPPRLQWSCEAETNTIVSPWGPSTQFLRRCSTWFQRTKFN